MPSFDPEVQKLFNEVKNITNEKYERFESMALILKMYKKWLEENGCIAIKETHNSLSFEHDGNILRIGVSVDGEPEVIVTGTFNIDIHDPTFKRLKELLG